MADEDERSRAELAFLDARLAELHAELMCNGGVRATPIDDETAPQIIADVVNALRAAGKADLAMRYGTAIQHATAAIDHHRTLIAQGADDRVLQVARDAQDDAIEELQRVDAEVDQFFEKGGI